LRFRVLSPNFEISGVKIMVAFEVYLNGQKKCTAGIGELGVLSAILSWRGAQPYPSGETPESESLVLSVSGMEAASRQHARWFEQELRVGDEIRINVVETATPDKPGSVCP
jgi:hypothetical protein